MFGEKFETRPENDFSKHFIQFTGCTLWTQGREPEVQPLFSEYGCLLFNGDIFDDSWDENQSDTRQLFERLNPLVSKIENLINCIFNKSVIEYFIIFFNFRTKKVWKSMTIFSVHLGN